ncbi:MAG: reverse transcriptase domain-containing protein [bacterium]
MAKAKRGSTKRKRGQRQDPSELRDFRVILDLPEALAMLLRELLHVSKANWTFLMDRIRQHKAGQNPIYLEWSKSKGPGKGRRHFAAPCSELKFVQQAILNQLLLAVPVHFVRHGGRRGSSILTAAETHLGAKSALSIDLVNAFPTVHRSRVKGCLKTIWEGRCRMFRAHGLRSEDEELMLEALVDLVTFKECLPQGAPTSPQLLDIVCYGLDEEIYGLLVQASTPFSRFTFTFYVDDAVISSRDSAIPDEVREAVLAAIKKHGFIAHTRADKCVYYSPETGTVPIVHGLVLTRDGRLTIAPGRVNSLRARLDRLFRKPELNAEDIGLLAGTLGFIRQVYPGNIPAKLRKYVECAKQRLEAERNNAPVTIVTDIPSPEEDQAEDGGDTGQMVEEAVA